MVIVASTERRDTEKALNSEEVQIFEEETIGSEEFQIKFYNHFYYISFYILLYFILLFISHDYFFVLTKNNTRIIIE